MILIELHGIFLSVDHVVAIKPAQKVNRDFEQHIFFFYISRPRFAATAPIIIFFKFCLRRAAEPKDSGITISAAAPDVASQTVVMFVGTNPPADLYLWAQ